MNAGKLDLGRLALLSGTASVRVAAVSGRRFVSCRP
jgi:hypothetical protein